MKTRQGWRRGIGLAQIMALLLVVLPTMAFIVTLLLDYWTVMQADYRLKIIANLGSDYANGITDARDFGDANTTLTLLDPVNSKNLCPNGTTLGVKTSANDAPFDQINLYVEYTHNGPYLNKTLSTSMLTYSYHDQNLTATLECI